MSTYSKEYYEINKEKIKESNRRSNRKRYNLRREKNRNLKRMFNVTIEYYEELYDKQNGLCALCGLKEDRKHKNGIIFSLAVDHNHTTGKIRGLLCSRCNMAIGGLRDDVNILQKAIEYLKQ